MFNLALPKAATLQKTVSRSTKLQNSHRTAIPLPLAQEITKSIRRFRECLTRFTSKCRTFTHLNDLLDFHPTLTQQKPNSERFTLQTSKATTVVSMRPVVRSRLWCATLVKRQDKAVT